MKNIEGMDIIHFLEKTKKIKLRKRGIIAGQSIAEAYFRLKNIPIYSRVKDIDLFSDNISHLSKYSQEIKKERSYFTCTKTKQEFFLSKSSFGFCMSNKEDLVKIKNTVDCGDINLIYAKHNSVKNSYIKSIVDSFDINMTQIGVDLKTGKLYKTKYFEDFVDSKKLKIVNYNSPITSLFRLFEKRETTEGILLDENKESELVLIKTEFYKDNFYFKGKGVTKDRYHSFTDKTKSKISKYFDVEIKTINFPDIDNVELFLFNNKKNVLKDEMIENISFLKKNMQHKKEKEINEDILFPLFDRTFLKRMKNKKISNLYNKSIKTTGEYFLLSLASFNAEIDNISVVDFKRCSLFYCFTTILLSKGYTYKEISNQITRLKKNKMLYIINGIEDFSLSHKILKKQTKEIKKIYLNYLKNIDDNYKYKLNLEIENLIQISSIINLFNLKNKYNLAEMIFDIEAFENARCFYFTFKSNKKEYIINAKSVYDRYHFIPAIENIYEINLENNDCFKINNYDEISIIIEKKVFIFMEGLTKVNPESIESQGDLFNFHKI